MSRMRFTPTVCILLMLAAVALWLVTGFTLADAATSARSGSEAGSATALAARHVALKAPLAGSIFKRPLVLESSQTANDINGDIYAVVPTSFDKLSGALGAPQGWCEILILHLNTKFCKVSGISTGTTLTMNVGKKFDQPLEDSFRLAFNWQLRDQTANYLRVQMSAETGPFSTRDYRITLEAVALENGSTFMHLSYSYGFGLVGKLAMQAYFNTVGRHKVGFTTVGLMPDGKQAYVDGMRGLVERNTMRYYLAIESFLGALAVPERMQFEKRITDWFDASERFPRQLHEMERADYLSMKRREYIRQHGIGIGSASLAGQG